MLLDLAYETGWRVIVVNDTLAIVKHFRPNDKKALKQAMKEYTPILGLLEGGRVWGTDPATALRTGTLVMNRRGLNKKALRALSS